MVIGLLHPGEMGSAVGEARRGAGRHVVWASDGRSAETAARAAPFEDVGTADELAGRSDVILSVCPPHAALDVARSVAGFEGIYVDANAVSPATAREIGATVGRFVDGGIVGPPPRESGDTRLYLAGREGETIAGLFEGTAVDARVLPG